MTFAQHIRVKTPISAITPIICNRRLAGAVRLSSHRFMLRAMSAGVTAAFAPAMRRTTTALVRIASAEAECQGKPVVCGDPGGLSGRRATCRWLAVPFSGRRPRRDAPCRSCRRAEAVDAHTDHALAARQTAGQAHRLRPGGAQTARHLQPFPATNRMASMTTRFEIRAFPRRFGGRGRKMAY